VETAIHRNVEAGIHSNVETAIPKLTGAGDETGRHLPGILGLWDGNATIVVYTDVLNVTEQERKPTFFQAEDPQEFWVGANALSPSTFPGSLLSVRSFETFPE
jgi:hypothetical protein